LPKDDRVTLKFDKEFWNLVAKEIDEHPEWGVTSVPDFVRRAVDNELNARRKSTDRKMIELRFNSRGSQEDIRDKAP
jgi:hypothetical protein